MVEVCVPWLSQRRFVSESLVDNATLLLVGDTPRASEIGTYIID